MTNLSARLGVLADPTRRTVFERLAQGPRSVTQLAHRLPVTRPAVSQHLRVLKDVGLVSSRAVGTRRLYQVEPRAIAELRNYFDRFWSDALAAFKQEAEHQYPPPQGTRK
jgi:DNA-binding transcriptional ArsR family regulator